MLSGGVFQNRYLTRKCREILESGGLKVYSHCQVPCNDAGIALGQVAIGLWRLAQGGALSCAQLCRCGCWPWKATWLPLKLPEERGLHQKLVPEIKAGDYGLLHAGIIIQKVDPEQARQTLALYEEIHGQSASR